MKTKITSLALVVAFLAFAVSSCTKEQKLARQLDGDWKAKYMVIAGLQVDIDTISSFTGFPITSAFTLSFEKCQKPDKGCPGHVTLGGTQVPFTYTLDGEEMNILGTLYHIDSIENDRLTLSTSDGNGGTYQIIFLKQ
ncbi:MAG: hypothetical protein U0V74_08520 [Chitinophagales bacterium]